MKRNKKVFLSIIFFLTIFLLPTQKPAYAYLDPGTGSLIFQVLAGVLLTIIYIIKRSYKNIKKFLTRLLSRKPKEKSDE